MKYWKEAESTNGRLAMIGLFAAVVNYGFTGWIIPGIFWPNRSLSILPLLNLRKWATNKSSSEQMVVQQWSASLYSVHHTQQLATLFLVSFNDKANTKDRREGRLLYRWEMEWHLCHCWMWSTYHILLTIRTDHTRFRLMNVPTYDIPASPILLVGFAGIAVALFTLYTVNKAYFNSPLNRWKSSSKLYS